MSFISRTSNTIFQSSGVFLVVFPHFSPQVLAGGAGPEAAAAAGGLLQGAGDLAGVSGWGGAEFHQPGLPQLWAHQPEPQRPGPLQLRGRSGGLFWNLTTAPARASITRVASLMSQKPGRRPRETSEEEGMQEVSGRKGFNGWSHKKSVRWMEWCNDPPHGRNNRSWVMYKTCALMSVKNCVFKAPLYLGLYWNDLKTQRKLTKFHKLLSRLKSMTRLQSPLSRGLPNFGLANAKNTTRLAAAPWPFWKQNNNNTKKLWVISRWSQRDKHHWKDFSPWEILFIFLQTLFGKSSDKFCSEKQLCPC